VEPAAPSPATAPAVTAGRDRAAAACREASKEENGRRGDRDGEAATGPTGRSSQARPSATHSVERVGLRKPASLPRLPLTQKKGFCCESTFHFK
jgi:hypothetical protein